MLHIHRDHLIFQIPSRTLCTFDIHYVTLFEAQFLWQVFSIGFWTSLHFLVFVQFQYLRVISCPFAIDQTLFGVVALLLQQLWQLWQLVELFFHHEPFLLLLVIVILLTQYHLYFIHIYMYRFSIRLIFDIIKTNK